jgi:hypothetical protein
VGAPSPFEDRARLERKLSVISQARASAQKYLELLPNPRMASALYDLILERLKPGSLNINDLSLTLWEKKGKRRKTIKLIDYLYHLLTPGVVNKEMRQLHSFLKYKMSVNLPDSFILNPHYRDQTQ